MWNGIWADLAKAPTSRQRQIATISHSLVVNTSGAFSKTIAVIDRTDVLEDQDRREVKADVADHVDHEGLHAGLGRRVPAVPVADQRVRKPTRAQPTISMMKLPARTRTSIEKTKEVQVAEEAVVAWIRLAHVAVQ